MATEYWSRHLRSVLAPLFAAAGTYSPADQESHLAFIDEHIAPNLGPLPWEPHGPYSTPSSLVGSPFDPSINIVSSGMAKVRFDFDVISPPNRTGPDPFAEKSAREILHHLADLVGADTQWMDSLMDALYLTPDEAEVAITKMPPGVAIPPSSVGFDFDGPERTLKFYIPCVRKALATGQGVSVLMLKTLRGLEPLGSELVPALDLITSYLSTCTNDAMLPLVGIDCLDPRTHKNARVKCYLHTSNNSFAVVRDVLTLGGRLNDAISLKRVETLKSIWPFLINELEGPQSDAYTIEITPGQAIPDTKVYVPLFQYTDSSGVAERNFESALKKLGNDWGVSGKYRRVMQGIFKDVENYGQTYASFSYTEAKGVYTTSYVAMPIKDEGGGGLAGDFGFRD
ncbi:aromatic prenyltransferase [Aspergillus granulosus]|uniref:Aromatic prenyltransferase n=1 Tax=Aspergillus granulosus TaxID=176169 RepID=A0ABR4GVY9_9EURO